MRTATQCRIEAARMTSDAEGVRDAVTKRNLLQLADEWTRLAATANWQDSHPLSETYRFR